jgi:hypothetical protein
LPEAYLKAPHPEPSDQFGTQVSLDGTTLAVGAPEEDSSASGLATDVSDNDAEDSGAVYSFVRVDSTWEPLATLKATNSEAGDGFGFSVWLEGDRLAVGATLEDSAATGVNGDQSDNSRVDSGAVYVFE